MTAPNRAGKERTRVLIVGGLSRAAAPVRAFFAQQTDHVVVVHVRGPTVALAGETIVQVADYGSGIPQDMDAVISFVGCVKGPQATQDHVNVTLLKHIAIAAKAARARCFINLSTLAVYGEAERISDATPERPTTGYGHSKLAGDRVVLDQASADFRALVLRVPTLYGDAMPSKIGTLARAVYRTGLIPVHRPQAQRSILHVQNLARVLDYLVGENLQGVQFAADPELFSIERLAEAMAVRRGKPVWTPTLPGPFLGLMRRVVPGPVKSLYDASVIDPDLPVRETRHPLLPLDACLARAF